jgi:hypothetical protein
MQDSEPVPLPGAYERLCVLAHDLNNKLSIIVGECELLSEHDGVTPECAHRLARIKDLAIAMSKRINSSDCRMVAAGEEQRKSTAAPPSVGIHSSRKQR